MICKFKDEVCGVPNTEFVGWKQKNVFINQRS